MINVTPFDASAIAPEFPQLSLLEPRLKKMFVAKRFQMRLFLTIALPESTTRPSPVADIPWPSMWSLVPQMQSSKTIVDSLVAVTCSVVLVKR